MKITSNREPEAFDPITFNITVESIDELHYLWNVFNTSEHRVEQDRAAKFNPENVDSYALWKQVDKFVKREDDE